MNILVTGSTGFLGKKITSRFIENEWHVGILLRGGGIENSYNNIGVITKCKENGINITNVVPIEDFNPNIIVHLACCYGRQGEKLSLMNDVNVRLGLRLIESVLSKDSNSLLFLNAGTSLNPEISNYALSKHQFSQWGKSMALSEGARLNFIDVRIQQMYGENDDRSKFSGNVIEACRNNEPKIDMSPAEQYRDFIYVDDVVFAFETIIKNAASLNQYEVIELGSGNAVRLRDFAELVRSISGATTVLNIGATQYRKGEQMYSVADLSRMNEFGWNPKYSLRSGIGRVFKN